ncbi:MAG TPA: hypothetical protein VEA80_12090 [Vitreimonas sp.]|uniref:WapI family immunity protein n=1 Tax=Vitreimonas sp. TaxID=3069702 RepID=UPI002D3B5C07|nr:hypothetical protein [Vitreimonas sp.]HYD88211.1 hypothetical protein [Vitreimonas sp.]
MVVIGSPTANVSLSFRGRHEELGYILSEGTFQVSSLSGAFSTLLMEPERFISDLERMDKTLTGNSTLSGIDQEVAISVSVRTLGGVEVNARFDDHQSHKADISFSMDQTYLGPLARALRTELGAAQ